MVCYHYLYQLQMPLTKLATIGIGDQKLLHCFSYFLSTEIVNLIVFLLSLTKRFLLNPSLVSDEHLSWFKFLGILFGVAVRTKKPLDLHLAPTVWKQIAGMPLSVDDLEEVDLVYIQNLRAIKNIHKSGVNEHNFYEVILSITTLFTSVLF